MFIQVIEGKVKDQAALHKRLEVWERDLMPGAVGYLGSTGGCTSNGDCCLIARFESRAAAMKNSARPEQGAWWAETQRCFTGPVAFHDTEEVLVMEHGNLDSARFVQVMDGHVTDRQRAIKLERDSDKLLAEMRPDLLGTVTAFYDDNFTELAYFASEAAARTGEQQKVPDSAQQMIAQWERLMPVDRYLDIKEPWLTHR